MSQVELLAEAFFKVFYSKQWPADLLANVAGLSIEQAYQVQDLVCRRRAGQGEVIRGYKVGCTSQAIRSQFGLQEPISARLFAPYVYEEDTELDWQAYLNCAIEPEMVMKMARDLTEANPSDEELLDAIDFVGPGIEIHNYKFWFSPPSSQELICSGGIHAGLVVGRQKVPAGNLSFKGEQFRVYKDGALITQGGAEEIMGGPLESLRWLVNALVKRGQHLKKGSLVIPGSPVELVRIDTDTSITIDIDQVGRLSTRFVRAAA